MLPSVVLAAGGEQAHGQLLRHPHRLNAHDFCAELAGFVGFGEQGVKHTREAAFGQGALQLNTLGREGGCGRCTKRAGGVPPKRERRLGVVKKRLGVRQMGEIGERLSKRFHRIVNHPRRVSQHELNPFAQGFLQRFDGLEAAQPRHVVEEVLTLFGQSCNGSVKTRPDQRNRLGVVFQQLVGRGQSEFLQHRERCAAQQGRKPAVKGAHLHRTAERTHPLVQRAQLGRAARGVFGAQTARPQFDGQRRVGQGGAAAQFRVEPLAHFASGFFGEGDGQDVLRRATVKQRANDARDQHPGFAGASAGLYCDAARRVAGQRVKRLARHGGLVDAVGGGVLAHGALQWSLRQRPRAAQ